MSTPNSRRTMRHRALTQLELLVVLAVIAGMFIYAALPTRTYWRERAYCQSNLKQLALAISLYHNDSLSLFPPVSAEGRGWAELLAPYMEEPDRLQCWMDSGGIVAGKTDYFYNARLAAVSRTGMEYPHRTLMFGEGESNASSNSHLSELPLDWIKDENSPAKRHRSKSYYLYADGHIKSNFPEFVSNQRPYDSARATFAVR